MLGNGPQVLGNGNGPHMLGIMSHSDFVAFGIMSHSGLCGLALCRSGLCRIRGYVVQHNVAFGITSHSALCRSGLCHSAKCRLAKCRSEE